MPKHMFDAIFPGSFDPPTHGHFNVITRCTTIFSHIHVVVANNSNKEYSMSIDMRHALLRKLVCDFDNVSVHIWDKLIVDFAALQNIRVIVRGLRAMEDFEYEFQLSMINKGLNKNIETLFIPTDPRYFVLRSSAIKELVRFGGDIRTMVPEAIVEEVRAHYLR